MGIERWRNRVEVRIVNLTAEELESFDGGEYVVTRVEYDHDMRVAAVHLRRRAMAVEPNTYTRVDGELCSPECQITCADGFKTTQDGECDGSMLTSLAAVHGGQCTGEQHN